MTSRSADASILGYYYQFDIAILKLLSLDSGSDSITLEGIEDIDVNKLDENTYVQCKYYSSKEYTPSAIRKPISLMLMHFKNSTNKSFKYNLYAYYSDSNSGQIIITLEELKEILTYTKEKVKRKFHEENNIADKDLLMFLKNFTITISEEFAIHQEETIEKLRKHFECSKYIADHFFYNNAIRVVLDLATSKNELDRKITKKEFLKKIDCGRVLFNDWYIKYKSKNDYIININRNLKALNILAPSIAKSIVIGKDIIQDHEMNIPNLVESLTRKYYQVEVSLRTTSPLCFIIEDENNVIEETKKHLIGKGIPFNDGYESILFNASYLNSPPILNLSKSGKIKESSFHVKIISRKTYEFHISDIRHGNILINFSKQNWNINLPENTQFFDIKYAEDTKDVYKSLI